LLPVQQWQIFDDLRELSFGDWEGLTKEQCQSRTPEAYAAWDQDAYLNAPPGGESARMVRNRVVRFLLRIEAESDESHTTDILVVAHGGQLRIMLTVLLNLPLAACRSFVFSNCGLSRVTLDDDHRVLDFHNAVLWSPDGEAMLR
jgi:broad specificity phosphatase PhoE